MTPERIRWLDAFVGAPVCAVLTLIERVRSILVPAPHGLPRRVVFVKLIEMGSTVLAAPCFQEAVDRVGRGNVFLLVFRRNRPIADLMGVIPPENIVEVDDASLKAFVVTLWKALRRIRLEQIDTAVDLEGLTRSSAIITWLSGATRRAGYYNFTSEGPYRGRLFNRELNYGFQRHTAVAFLAVTRAVFHPRAERPLLKERIPEGTWRLPRFQPQPAERQKWLSIIADETGTRAPSRIVILNPNCSDLLPLRRWQTSSFVQLGQRLLQDDERTVLVVSGAPEEQRAAESLARSIAPNRKGCVSLAGRTSFRELMVLLSIGDVLVSNDSGPCHFAALTDIAVVALFGPETPQLYGPLGDRVRCVSSDLACSPCVNMLNHRFSPCTDNRCMQEITVDRVYEAVCQLSRAPMNP